MYNSQTFSRTKLLIGNNSFSKLQDSKVVIFGVGGVGSYVAESLARAGIGEMLLIDYDKIELSNINRQIHALHSTVGKYKTHVMKSRIKDINPDIRINSLELFYSPKEDYNESDFQFTDGYDYIVDAVDNVTAKISIIENCYKNNISIISSMGTANRLDPQKLKICDIYETTGCPLAKIIRKELRKREINFLKTLFSTEPPITNKDVYDFSEYHIKEDNSSYKRKPPLGSISFVPSVAGLIIASEVVKDIISRV